MFKNNVSISTHKTLLNYDYFWLKERNAVCCDCLHLLEMIQSLYVWNYITYRDLCEVVFIYYH